MLLRQFAEKERHNGTASASESQQFAILSQLLLPGLQDHWVGFPKTAKFWKSRNELKIGEGSIQISRRYDSNGK